MPPAPLPIDEADRLAALRTYEVLDTVCEDSFDSIARLAARLSGCPIALVSLIDRDRQWFKARHGLEVSETHRDVAFCAHAILNQAYPMVVADALRDTRFIDNALVTGEPGIRFYAGVPLVNCDGHALGTLCIIDRAARQIGPDVLESLVGLAGSVTTTLELRRALLQMQRMALTDRLTGLPNRPALMAALGKAIARQRRDNQPFCLLYIDLDHFKSVNDRLGHAAGDRVLVEAAAALTSCMRGGDTVARIGGDEFVALLSGGDGQAGWTTGERVRRHLQARMNAGGWNVTASVGAAAFFQPPVSEDAALAAADDLMYAAKVAGKNRVLCKHYSASNHLPFVSDDRLPGIES